MKKFVCYLPLFLSSFRLFFACTLWPFFVFWYADMPWSLHKMYIVGIFVVVCLTDFFDGFLARRFECTSRFGAFLDHYADKALVVCSLVPLVSLGRIHFFWVLIFIMRELYILALRYGACSLAIQVPVSWWGKGKTWAQFMYLICVLCCAQSTLFENFLLALAVGATVISAVMYTRDFIRQMGDVYL